MDSLTQVVLGASVAAVCVPKGHRRKAALIGAALGTLPDLDVFLDYGDAVSNFTFHRGFSHSLFVLFPFSLLLWAILKRVYTPVRTEPTRWLLAISLTLITHPLLDAHTAYGTQLFWPLSSPPIMWSTLFIIDPFYTLPLLIGVIAVLISPKKRGASVLLISGVILSSSYLAWSWVAKGSVDSKVKESLSSLQIQGDIFTTPTPFNTALWRVVVMQDDSYLEGYYRVIFPFETIEFKTYPNNKNLLDQTDTVWAVDRLEWFAQGFNKVSIIDNQLVISDLRMGFEGSYVFQHAVAESSGPVWNEIDSTLLDTNFNADILTFVWNELTKTP